VVVICKIGGDIMKIGIFGGSFNPPHKMHRNIALKLLEKNYVDKIIYVPTGNKYNKKDLIDAKYRIEMLKLMIQKNSNIVVSDYEVKNVLTYTYQTLDYFRSIFPDDEIYFICGSDNLKEITTWKNYEYILNNYKLLAIQRNDDEIEKIVHDLNTSNIVTVKMSSHNVSSTNIRNDLKNQKSNDDLDTNVMKYIKRNQLYC